MINRKVSPKKKKSKISKKAENPDKKIIEIVEFQFALVNRLHRITPILTINEGISSLIEPINIFTFMTKNNQYFKEYFLKKSKKF